MNILADNGGNPDYLSIMANRAAAYSGNLGEKRKEFCLRFIENKKTVFKQISARQIATVSKQGKSISCHQGCTYCCLAYMQASIQECEAIVYYLYSNDQILTNFINNYAAWRQKLRQNGDIFIGCGESWLQREQPDEAGSKVIPLQEMEAEYREQAIYCPFLNNGSCSIYDVRPFTCAAIVAATPPEWCSPASGNSPSTYVFTAAEVFDTSFYYNKIEGTVLAFMPLAVYSILTEGYRLLDGIPGLEGIQEASSS